MKTIDSVNESNKDDDDDTTSSCTRITESVKDHLIDSNKGHNNNNLLKCNPYLVLSYDVLKKTPDKLKDRFYQRVLAKNNVTQEHRCQSLPTGLDEENNTESNLDDTSDNCDTNRNLPINSQVTTTSDLWFKTWPEKRYEKPRNDNCGSNDSSPTRSKTFNNQLKSPNKLSFNEALQNISLAYSPITKQLHFVENNTEIKEGHCNSDKSQTKGHKRNDPGSFSSTISSLSDPSSSGSLLDSEDQQPLSLSDYDKSKMKAISSFFHKGVFNWKSPSLSSASGVWKFFGKAPSDINTQNSPQHEQVIASSSALIQHNR